MPHVLFVESLMVGALELALLGAVVAALGRRGGNSPEKVVFGAVLAVLFGGIALAIAAGATAPLHWGAIGIGLAVEAVLIGTAVALSRWSQRREARFFENP